MNLDEGVPAPASRRAPQRRQPKPPRKWKTPAAVIAGVAVTGVLAAFALSAQNGGMQATEPVPQPPAATATAEAPHSHAAEVDPTAWSTFVAFWSGWSSDSAKTRAAVFADTATDSLAEGLAETASYKLATVRKPVETVEVVGASDYAVELRVTFRNTDTGPLRVMMAADPEAESGWLVTDISQIDG